MKTKDIQIPQDVGFACPDGCLSALCLSSQLLNLAILRECMLTHCTYDQ